MKLIFSLTFVLSLLACQNTGTKTANVVDEHDAMHNQIMEIHDEVMPKMGSMRKLRKKLIAIEPQTEESKTAIKNLVNADEFMMDWMAEYRVPEGDKIAKSEYLENELKRVKQLKSDINGSIESAKQILSTQ